jgi:hypothetical protein
MKATAILAAALLALFVTLAALGQTVPRVQGAVGGIPLAVTGTVSISGGGGGGSSTGTASSFNASFPSLGTAAGALSSSTGLMPENP